MSDVVLITGGASGLGFATAQEMLSGGRRVVLLDRDNAGGTAAANALGDNARFVQTDVTDAASVKAARDFAVSEFGTIHAVVNCAGVADAAKTIGRDGAHDLALFQKVIDINLIGSFNVARLAAEVMADNTPDAHGQRGVIIHTSSIAAYEAQRGQTAYGASKGAVASMVLPMARDLAELGIRVMAIAPGLFLTPMLQGLPDKARDALSDLPLFPKRLGDPSEFGKLAAFILDAPYLNASVIRLDGGIRLP